VKHGFKASANKKSEEIRKTLGLRNYDALDCFNLAIHLKVPIFKISELASIGFPHNSINILCKNGFSAVTILTPYGKLIVYNNLHSPSRINSDLSHEISHIICDHDFSSITEMITISREFDKNKEDEANWLGGCLLLPEKGLVWAIRQKMSIEDIANHFNISVQMARWRFNVTGMAKRKKYIR
jgi:Zn-dependent peptidase ImmA (M78 family)